MKQKVNISFEALACHFAQQMLQKGGSKNKISEKNKCLPFSFSFSFFFFKEKK